MTDPRATDVTVDGKTTWVTLTVALVREDGEWSRIETCDGEILSRHVKMTLPAWIEKAADEAEAEVKKPVVFDCERGRA